MDIRNLEPKELWNHFADLNAVPRPSKKEERVIKFMLDFGNSLGLETKTDKILNVIIKKPATLGMENRKTVILQSHLDMVHQKNSDTVFDFDAQGIEMIVDGDWVKANGTTLGADNGIGVASIMAVLASNDISHPAIEAMFTIDEETGMTGAMELDGSNFQGEILLNLDTEDDDELSIGCAGGIDTSTKIQFELENLESDSVGIEIEVRGLIGGHSGMDIDKGRGNANKIMNRILYFINDKHKIQLISLNGGSLRNAIPREAICLIAVPKDAHQKVLASLNEISEIIKFEFSSIESELDISFKTQVVVNKAINSTDLMRLLNVLSAVPNGVFRMSPDIEGLVEASSNLAIVILQDGEFVTQSLQRSSVESTKVEIANSIKAAFELIGCEVIQNGEYPGWRPNANSEILALMRDLYVAMYKEDPKVKACHAGLECGILLQHLPDVDMISFGPNIRAAHSPDEKVQISSVQKFWSFFIETLKLTPQKD